MSSYRDEARRALESSVARESQNKYLNQIKTRHPSLQGFESTDALLNCLRDPIQDADQKDAILLALLVEHQASSDGGAFALLAIAMFPALDHIYRERLHRVLEADDLWGRIVGAFAEAIDRYPTQRRPARVAANIEGDTLAHLRRAKQLETQTAMAQELLCEVSSVRSLPYLDEIEAVDPEVDPSQRLELWNFEKPDLAKPAKPDPEELEWARAAVAPLFDQTGSSPVDRFLVLGVHLYECSLGDLAAELGISREAAKKRHARALWRIRETRSGKKKKQKTRK